MNTWNNVKNESTTEVTYNVKGINKDYKSYDEALAEAMRLPLEEVTIEKTTLVQTEETASQTIENTLFKEISAKNAEEIKEIINRVRDLVANATASQLLQLMTENTYRIMRRYFFGQNREVENLYSLQYIKEKGSKEAINLVTEIFRDYVLNLFKNYPIDQLIVNQVDVWVSNRLDIIPYISISFKNAYNYTQSDRNVFSKEILAISHDPRLYCHDDNGSNSTEPDHAYLIFSGIEKEIRRGLETINGLKIEILKGFRIMDEKTPVGDLSSEETQAVSSTHLRAQEPRLKLL